MQRLSRREKGVALPIADAVGGDQHRLRPDGIRFTLDPDAASSPSVAAEIVGTSITSRSFVQPWMLPALIAENPHLRYGHSEHRGYVRVDLTPAQMSVDLRASESIATRDAASFNLARFVIENGRPAPLRA